MTRAPLTPSDARYVKPSRFDALFNRAVRRLVRMGISVWGARDLRLKGRKSGQVRSNVVNLLELDGEQYLVAPRGTTEWVKNLRAAIEHGEGGELRVGRRAEKFEADELPDAEKGPILRAYLKRWKWEVGRFFENVSADSSDAEVAGIAPGFPVFKIRRPSAS
jgi:hypothetical protein